MKPASKQFIVERQQTWDRRPGKVNVRSTKHSLEQMLCLAQFRRTFGFTPLKGKTYKVTISDFQVEEIAS